MALSARSYTLTTTTQTWSDLAAGPAIITSIVLANKTNDDVVVSVRIFKPTGSAILVPNDILPDGQSARIRLPSLPIASNEKIQVTSSGEVDWVASGMTET